MREVVGDGLCFGFWVVLVVCLVGLLVAGWFGALVGFGAVFCLVMVVAVLFCLLDFEF